MSDKIETSFYVVYGGVPNDMPQCWCALDTATFGGFCQLCPATALQKLSMKPDCRGDGKRCITVKTNGITIAEQIELARNAVVSIKDVAQNCVYNRGRKTK